MPNQVSPGFDRGFVSMSDAPGADIGFDDLFPPETNNLGAPQAPPQGTNPQEPPQATPPTEADFIRAGQTVYRTREDAEKGIDPDELKPRPKAPEPTTTPEPPSQFKYYQNPKMFDELSEAVKAQDKVRYQQILEQHNLEQMNAVFAPVAPYIAEVARQRAVRQVADEVPDFTQFINSQGYRETLKSLPSLEMAVKNAESNFAMAENLGELYKIAYLVNQGRNRSANPAPIQQSVPPPAVRPTTAPSTMTPPAPAPPTSDWTTNRDSRRQLIKDMEGRGIKDVAF